MHHLDGLHRDYSVPGADYYCHDDAVCSCCPCLDHCVDPVDLCYADCCGLLSPVANVTLVEEWDLNKALGLGSSVRKKLEDMCRVAVEVLEGRHIQV